MKGVVFKGNRRIELLQFDDPTPGPGEVVIAIKASGLCGSDLHLYRRAEANQSGIIGGHEPAGEVVAVGPGVTNPVAKIGTRVMVHHYHGCGACPDCRTGWTQMCTDAPMRLFGATAHGAHAEYMKVPVDTLIGLHDGLSYIAGAAIGCGTGTAWGVLDRLSLTGRDTVAVFGQGPVGLSTTLFAAELGARVIALDLSPERLELAKAFGAHETINPVDGQAVDAIRALTGGRGVSIAIETSGASSAADAALSSLGKWGKLALVGLGSKLEIEISKVLMRQITVLTSWSMSWVGQKACADFIVDRGLNIDRLFSDRFTLDQCFEAYELFDRQTSGKAAFVN